MNVAFVFLFLTFIAVNVNAQTRVSSGFFLDRGHPGKCVINSKVLNPKEEYEPPGECKRYSCDNEFSFGTIYECMPQYVAKPCKLSDPIHPHDSYPYCCIRELECP